MEERASAHGFCALDLTMPSSTHDGCTVEVYI